MRCDAAHTTPDTARLGGGQGVEGYRAVRLRAQRQGHLHVCHLAANPRQVDVSGWCKLHGRLVRASCAAGYHKIRGAVADTHRGG
jgi:hypothetical protein